MSVTPTHVFKERSIELFTDEELYDWLHINCNTQRKPKALLRLLRYYIDFALSKSLNIKREDNIENLPFISRDTQMQIGGSSYKKVQDVCFDLHNGYITGNMCKHIIGFKPAFINLVLPRLKARGRKVVQAQGSAGCTFDPTLDRSNLTSPLPYSVIIAQDEEQHTVLLDYFWPGDVEANYVRSPNSHRRFSPAGRLTKEMVNHIYDGFVDFDINNCYANIFIKWCEAEGYRVPQEMLLIRNDKASFYKRVIDENCFDWAGRQTLLHEGPEAAAKVMLLKLFHAPKCGRRKFVGNDWYDNLASFVDSVFFNTSIADAHLFFSKIEAEVIRQAIIIIGPDNFVVDKHDGFIAKIKKEDLQQKLTELQSETGYCWKAKILGETK